MSILISEPSSFIHILVTLNPQDLSPFPKSIFHKNVAILILPVSLIFSIHPRASQFIHHDAHDGCRVRDSVPLLQRVAVCRGKIPSHAHTASTSTQFSGFVQWKRGRWHVISGTPSTGQLLQMCIRGEWGRGFFTKFGRKQIRRNRVCRQLGNSTTQRALARRWEEDAVGGVGKGG